jgi:PepSY-associated TM region
VSAPRQLVSIHRWLGVVLGLFMAAWFASGAVLIYVPFPSLSASDRLARTSDVDTSQLALAPADAISAAGISQPIDRFRLIAREGRPLYVLHPRGEAARAVWGDDGSDAGLQTEEAVRRIAADFSGMTVRQIQGPLDYDQWIVHQAYDQERPFFRVQLDHEAGTVLYVSQRSGEVLLRTRRAERAWNYVGAVVHWIYPTVLRRNWAAWDQVVWWLSLAGIIAVLIGIWLGIDRMLIAFRRRKITLYRGWLKWHHILGLCTFLFVLTWIFSGWLSMDHGRLFSMPDPTTEQIDRFRGITLAEAARHTSVDFVRSLDPFRELQIKAVAGSALAVVRTADVQRIHAVSSGQLDATPLLPRPLIRAAVQRAWPEFTIRSIEAIEPGDVYRQVRQSKLPDSTLRVTLSDADNTWVHVDAAAGDIVSVMDRGRRWYRWLFNGLHSLDIPGLVGHRPLWDVVILTFLAVGFTFTVTGAFLGIRHLKRSIQKAASVQSSGS